MFPYFSVLVVELVNKKLTEILDVIAGDVL